MDDLASFVQQAANETVVIAMIESLEGLEQLDEILKVEGIDIILEGAANLSQSVGMSWQSSHPKVKEIDTYSPNSLNKFQIYYF